MKLKIEPLTLQLETPIRTARRTGQTAQNVLVHLGESIGEAALMPHVSDTQADVIAYLEALNPDTLVKESPLSLVEVLDELPEGPQAARAAIDMALYDHWAKELGYPLYRLWGLTPKRTPLSSVTISIPEDEINLRQQVEKVKDWPILKIKLGTGDLDIDEDIVRLVHEETSARLCVDANGAWSVDEAARIIPRLQQYDLLFIEQPVAAEKVDVWVRLRRLLSSRDVPPLIADESVQTPRDITALSGLADGINVKVAKVGGLRTARRMVALGRTLGMKVLLGCTVESSVGITAAAHLAPMVDFADLDGHLYVTNDPYVGINLERGKITLPREPGLGIVHRPQIG